MELDARLSLAARAYAPRLAQGQPAGGWALRFEAVVLLADVRGFTKLTEALSADHAHGAEVLAERLNGRLRPVVEAILAQGGDVLKFAGDAVVAAFQGPGAAARAWAAAEAASEGQAHGLSVKALLSCGELRVACLGGHEGRWETLVSGAAIRDLSLAVPVRAAVFATPAFLALQPRQLFQVGGEPVSDSGPFPSNGTGAEVTASDSPAGQREPVAAVPLDAVPLDAVPLDAAAWLPEAVWVRLHAGQAGWLAENRRVTAVFVALPDRDDLARVVTGIQRIVAAHRGTLNKLSADEKGACALVAFGLPPHAQEDDPARAVAAAVEIAALLASCALPVAIGVATGRAFCGEVGTENRREYTLLGDAVNAAARLTHAAADHGEVLVDGPTHAAAAGWRWAERGALSVKGKTATIAAFVPVARDAVARASGPMLGRDAEVAALLAAIRTPARGVVVHGEAGVGKTRLLDEVLSTVAGTRVVRTVAGVTGAGFDAWRPIFDTLYPATAALPEALRDLWPLLADFSARPAGETAFTEQLRGENRAFSAAKLAAGLLAAVGGGDGATPAPLVVVIDAAHHADSGSLLIAEEVVRSAKNVCLILTRRPLAGDAWARLETAPGVVALAVPPLGEADMRTLLRSGGDLPESLERSGLRRAGGIPLYAEALAEAFRGGLTEVPEEVTGFLQSRLDALPPGSQLVCKLASVVGDTFRVPVARAAHADPPPAEMVTAELHAAGAIVSHSQGDSWVFRQPLVREAVYGVLLLSQRHGVHARVAGWYEREGDRSDAAFPALVGHHWFAANEATRAAPWLGEAGTSLVERGVFLEGARLLRQALAASADLAAFSRARYQRLLGEAAYALGQHAEARIALEGSLSTLEQPMPRGIGWATARDVGRQIARRFGWHAAASALDAPTKEALEVLHALAPTLLTLSDMLPALYVTFRGLELAEQGQVPIRRATGFASMILVVGFVPLPRVAELYCRLAAEACPPDALDGQLYVHEATAIYRLGRGEWDETRAHAAAALALALRLGDRRRADECRSLLASEAQMRGDYATADRWAAETVTGAAERGDAQMVATWRACRAECALAMGDLDGAAAHLAVATRELPANVADPLLVRHLGVEALVAWRRGDREGAARAAAIGAEKIGSSRQLFIAALEGYSGVAEVVTGLWEADARRPTSPWAGATRNAISGLKRMARVFPPAQARLWHATAALAAPGRSRERAAAEARKAASALGMPDPGAPRS